MMFVVDFEYHRLQQRIDLQPLIEFQCCLLYTSKPGKESGGYCTFLPNWKMPFIFANFNGTKGDVEVFTHEGGHAYHCLLYTSRCV